MQPILRILKLFGSLRITIIGLALLLILTVWGTLYQAEYGLYLAQVKFYQSWFFLVGGFFPFPGAQLVMLMLFVNLTASILLLTLIGRMKWGFLITHVGLMLMLAAGAVTFYFGKNAYLSLQEGASSNVAISPNTWELALLPTTPGSHRHIAALEASSLKPGRTISLPNSKLALHVETYYPNCEAFRETISNPPENIAGYTQLKKRPYSREQADNRPGLLFTLLRDGEKEKRYLLWGGDPGPISLQEGNQTHLLGLRYQRLPLPASIQLVDFKRELHPGSGIAKMFSSQVIVKSGDDLDRTVMISMNKPLRIHGFTFYQSSFSDAPGGREISTLAVVQNYGRLMPYVATGLTVVGMILHFAGILIHRLHRNSPKEAKP